METPAGKAGVGSELAGRLEPMSAHSNPGAVIPFRPRSRRCAACLITFTPRHWSHKICGRCYAYHRVGMGIAIARRGLAETVQ
jgi:hypothetical protein